MIESRQDLYLPQGPLTVSLMLERADFLDGNLNSCIRIQQALRQSERVPYLCLCLIIIGRNYHPVRALAYVLKIVVPES